MYPLANVTPYWHAFSNHVADHMRSCAQLRLPLANLTTEPVEKKNHEHTAFFFHNTLKNGGLTNQNPLLMIMKKENRYLFPKTTTTPPKKEKKFNYSKTKKPSVAGKK